MKRSARFCLAAASAASVIVFGMAGAQVGPSGAGVELPREVVSAAATFAAYMDHAAGLGHRFADAGEVAAGVRTGVTYEPAQFQEGMIGYGAVVALQEGRFLNGLDEAVSRAGGRRALADRLAADPAAVLQISGAGDAARRVASALELRGASVLGNGRQVKQAAYDIQHQAWSTKPAPNAAGRLAEVKSLSSAPLAASDGEGANMIKAVLETRAEGGDGRAPTPLVIRALALAAEAELGAARNDDLEHLRPLLSERATTDCLRMSKLNLYQCMAVAGPHYEDVFCLGQHALMDTGQCVSNAATGTMAVAAAAPRQLSAADRAYIVAAAQRTPAGD